MRQEDIVELKKKYIYEKGRKEGEGGSNRSMSYLRRMIFGNWSRLKTMNTVKDGTMEAVVNRPTNFISPHLPPIPSAAAAAAAATASLPPCRLAAAENGRAATNIRRLDKRAAPSDQ